MSNLLQKHLDDTIQPYLDIPTVEDININAPTEIFYECAGGQKSQKIDKNLSRTALMDLSTAIANYNGINWHHDRKPLSARLPDGERIEVVANKAATSTFTMSIRKRLPNHYKLKDFGLTEKQEKYLIKAVKDHKNIVVSGGTSSGKTSFLENLCNYIPADNRIISIQDPVEINFEHDNQVSYEIFGNDKAERRDALEALITSALRQNPERLIFGEVREELMAEAALIASNTGHDGGMYTIHASSPEGAISRIRDLVYRERGGDIKMIEKEARQVIDIVIQLKKSRDGKRTAEIKYIDK